MNMKLYTNEEMTEIVDKFSKTVSAQTPGSKACFEGLTILLEFLTKADNYIKEREEAEKRRADSIYFYINEMFGKEGGDDKT